MKSSVELVRLCRKMETEAMLVDTPDLMSRIRAIQREYGTKAAPIKSGLALRYIAASELYRIKTGRLVAIAECEARKRQARVAPEEKI